MPFSDPYQEQAAEMSEAHASAGMAPYPLYGVPSYPMGQTTTEETVPFYRQPLVCFGAGAAVVGAAWLYFAWWLPRQQREARTTRNRRARDRDKDDEE